MNRKFLSALGGLVVLSMAWYWWREPAVPMLNLDSSGKARAMTGEKAAEDVDAEPDEALRDRGSRPPLASSPSIPQRRISASSKEYYSVADPLEQLLTARSPDDAAWMAENHWPTLEDLQELELNRDCAISEVAESQYSIDAGLPQAQACLAKLYAIKDSRFASAADSTSLIASPLRARLELMELLSRPLRLEDHERVAELAFSAWVLGDSLALDVVNRAGGVHQLRFFEIAGMLDQARQGQMYADSRRPVFSVRRPRPIPRDR